MGDNSLHYMYVLLCADQTLYTGYTTDLKRREDAHNNGKGAKYTKPTHRRPCHMIYAKVFSSKSEAMRAEYRFKQMTRPQKDAYLREKGVDMQHIKKGHLVLDGLKKLQRGGADETTKKLST